MKPMLAAGLAFGLCCAAPAQALEHRESIEHRAGSIAADYSAATRVTYRQVGVPGAGGRGGSLSCRWSVDLVVERRAALAQGHKAARTLLREKTLSGAEPGWCHAGKAYVERLVEARSGELRAALMALVVQDREAILAEAAQVSGQAAGRSDG